MNSQSIKLFKQAVYCVAHNYAESIELQTNIGVILIERISSYDIKIKFLEEENE